MSEAISGETRSAVSASLIAVGHTLQGIRSGRAGGPYARRVPVRTQTLARWIDDNGYRSVGFNRESYIDYGCGDDPAAWVTELQEPVVRSGGVAGA
jgi:hypothetical protein